MKLLRLLVTPRWLLRHLLVIGMCIGFFFLSRWQFHRGEQTSGTIQNYGYSVEWLAFGGCVCFGWWKMLQDELHPEGVKRKNRAMVAREPRSSPWRMPVAASAVGAVEGELVTAGTVTAGASTAGAVAALTAAAAPEQLPEPHRQRLHSADGEVPAALLVGRRPEALTTALIDPDDEEVVAYNAYLADLNAGRVRR